MPRERLEELAGLSALRRERSLAELSRASAECSRLRVEIDDLRDAVTAARLDAARSGDILQALGASRFASWAERKLAMLNIALAARMAEWQECREEAARAHGQSDVLGRLLAAQRKSLRLLSERKRAAEMPPDT
ncbi:hypothetical protein [Ostreiculturibacter nitratireducens]|uniref:hypothetical protein n=1 Tax=Ostreiculturibacter nitratireducens TaxID=3075226 RepID=UPI0031B5FFA1